MERESLVLVEEEVSPVAPRPETCLFFGLFSGARKGNRICPC